MNKIRPQLLTIYLAAVIFSGSAAIAIAPAGLRFESVTGPHPLAFFVFAVCLIVAELRPLNWLSMQDGGEVTASFTFALALLFIAPSFASILILSS